MITQEQANAIAEREYPYPIGSMPWYNYNQTRIEVGFRREAYAKCLMDMNPLIEAGEKMRSSHSLLVAFAAAHLPVQHLDNLVDAFSGVDERKAWDSALSNLTRSIEP